MTRPARIFSPSGIMHVIVRGIGRQLIFEDANDYNFFLKKLSQYALETDVKICAFCLMENHVHLLLKGESSQITIFMKKQGVSYSFYFNQKYDRTGHLFQDRYLSESVADQRAFLSIYRYILQNPQKAGICSASDYLWSSYRYYDNWPEYMDSDLIKALLNTKEKYNTFMSANNKDICLEYHKTGHDDEWALGIIKATLSIETGIALQKYDKKHRDAALKKLFEEGLTFRQIERLTGISRNAVARAVKK